MADPAKPPATPEAPIEYARSYGILFQTWLVLFLLVICFALANYLYSYIHVPK